MTGRGESAAGSGIRIAVEGRLEDLTPAQRELLLQRAPAHERDLRETVSAILRDVEERGDAALLEMARRFDGVSLEALEVPREAWAAARDRLAPEVRKALERAAANIEAFHRAQIPEVVTLEVEPGVMLERRWAPLEAVGVYAPGGLASYPSSVLMGTVPARAVGVPEIVVCSPPGEGGLPSDEVLAAAEIGGATRVFALGGAGAIGALARGTESVPGVAVIVGPGNRWVTEAKRQVAGDILIDSPAGPSEVLVVATEGTDPERVAMELVAQAEHDPEAAVALVTPSASLLEATREALVRQVERAPRREVIRTALASRGGMLLARDLEAARDFAREYGAEHLAIYTDDPRRDLEFIPSAGTVFLGEPATVAFGDYLTGANHVLPTAGLSRAFSGLSTLDYVRFYTVQELTEAAAAAMAEDVGILADAEGLPGHAAAARFRRSI